VNEIDRAFYDLVIKERDYERVRSDRLTRERDEALSRIKQLEADNQYLSNAVLRLQQEPS
jgi:hypothetical protein